MNRIGRLVVDRATEECLNDTVIHSGTLIINSENIHLKDLIKVNGNLVINSGGFYAPNLVEVTGDVVFGGFDKLFKVTRLFTHGQYLCILSKLKTIGGDLVINGRTISVEMKSLTTVNGCISLCQCNKLKAPKLIVHNGKPSFKVV